MEAISKLTPFTSFAQMLVSLPNDESCRLHLENIRWAGVPTCPHCKVSDEAAYKLKIKGAFNGLYKCRNCQKRFTVTVGTMFEGSHISLRKWFIAIYLFSSHKRGISSHQLAKDLGITQKSAWFVLGRIRYAFKEKSIATKFDGVIQGDETFVGGKEKNKHGHKSHIKEHKSIAFTAPRARNNDKIAVIGLMSGTGIVRAKSAPDVKAKSLIPFIGVNTKWGATIVTDEHTGYRSLGNIGYNHVTVNHKKGEYTNGNFHTNGMENFWSHFKRGIIGIYFHVSAKHIDRYCAEFSFRYNSRKITDAERFGIALKSTENFRLKYRDLISA